MKKLLSLIISLILILSLGLSAFAAPVEEIGLADPIIYEPETKLIGAPVVIENISTIENLKNLDKSPAPQGAWLDIGSARDMDAISIGKEKIALSYFLTCCETTTPILKVNNKRTAEALYNYLLEENEIDLIIASQSTSALKFFAKQSLDNITLAYIAKEKAKLEKIAETTHELGAKICVLEKADRETAEYLQSRFLSVTFFNEDLNTRDSLDSATNCGANGVVVNSAADTYKLYEKVKKTTYIRKPFIVANTAILSTKEAANTLEDLTKAFKAGADSVAVKIKFDEDDQVICFSDQKSLDKASLFEELCETLSEQKVLKTLMLEINDNNTQLVKEIKKIAKKKDVLNRILIINADPDVVKICREIIPEVGIGKIVNNDEAQTTVPSLLGNSSLIFEIETPKDSETVADDVSAELKTAGKTGALFLKTDYADLGKEFKDSIKFKSALDIFGDIEVTGISINKITLELRTGKSKTIKATVSPENATNKKVTWKSSDTKVATVDKNGMISAKRAGKTVITATADGGKFVTCVVTVKGYLVLILLILLFLGLIGSGFYIFKIKKINLKNIKLKIPEFKKKTNDDTKKPKHF